MPRICLYLKHLAVGGIERVIVELANGFVERGYEVDVVLSKGKGAMANALSPSVNVVALESRRMWQVLPRLLRYLKRRRPDTMLSAGVQENVIALWAKILKRDRLRLVLSVHSNMTEYSRSAQVWYARHKPRAIRAWYRYADSIVAVSTDVLRDLATYEPGADIRGTVIYNPVVSEAMLQRAREAVDHPWFLEAGRVPVIVSVGRMDPLKDQELLIRAFEKLSDRQEARLVFLGDGRERARLERLAHETTAHDKIAFLGFERNPYKYMTHASLLAVTSRFEGLGNVLIEALACGCPVVSTDCPSGPREILEDGKWGELVPVGDEDALLEALSKSLSTDHDVELLRRRALDFTVDKAVNAYISVLLSDERADEASS